MKKIVLIGLVFAGAVAFSLFPKSNKVSTENLLALSIQQNFCKLHKNKKECRNFRQKEFAFTLHGLWPQPRSRQNCSNRYERLPKKLWEELKEIMPGAVSGLAKHEWRKHGSCYGKSQQEYFKDAIMITKQVNSSTIREFFTKNQGRVITKQQLNQVLKFPRKVKMICKRGLITELRFSLKGDVAKESLEELQKDAKPLRGGCRRSKI